MNNIQLYHYLLQASTLIYCSDGMQTGKLNGYKKHIKEGD